MSIEEVKNTLKNMGFEEHSLYVLGVDGKREVAKKSVSQSPLWRSSAAGSVKRIRER